MRGWQDYDPFNKQDYAPFNKQNHAPSNKQDHPAFEVKQEDAPLASFDLLRCSFLCVVVAGKKQETGKRPLFNVALVRALFLLWFWFCLLSTVYLVLSSLID